MLTHIEVFIGGPLMLEVRLIEGLLEFGRTHPNWRFSFRAPGFHYTAAWLKRNRVSGALVMIDAASVRGALKGSGVPWVHLLPGGPSPHPYAVDVNDAQIGRMGAEKFLELGFQRFAFLRSKAPWSEVRADGFAARLVEAGHVCDRMEAAFVQADRWTPEPRSDRAVERWVRGLAKRTAVMAFSDYAATYLVDICTRCGLRVPDDIAVLGVGNHNVICEVCPVPITSIDTDVPGVARCGARMLEALIEKRPVERPCVLIEPRALIERRSTDVLAFDDKLIVRMINHSRDHVCDGLTVGQLAAALHVTRRTLTRRCVRALGHSPAAEMLQARLRHARRMLAGSNLTLTEIAMACGFADLPHMDKVFLKAYGVSPGVLRTGNREAADRADHAITLVSAAQRRRRSPGAQA